MIKVIDKNGNQKIYSTGSGGGGGSVISVSGIAPIASSGGANPTISISQATSVTDGYLTAADWITFDGKQDGITLTTTGSSGSATLLSNVLNIPTYTLSGLGGQPLLSGTGFIKASGTTISYDNSTYTPTSRTLTINGITYDLSANRSWTVTSMVYPSAGIAVSNGTGWDTSIVDNSTNWNTAYTNRITSLTTTGTGAATLVANVLNIPTPPTATFTSLTTTGSSGSATLLAGVLNVPIYTLSGLGGVSTSRSLTINGTSYDLSADRTWTVSAVSPLTTKGDIYVRNGSADTRLPIGLDTQILIADSTAATGIKWGSNTAATQLGYYGAWQDDFTQTAAVDNTGYAMKFHTADITPNGISIVNDGSGNPTRITFANTGIYNLQFSSQFQNADNAQHDVTIWLRLNGTDVSGSSGLVSVPARKAAGAGNEGHTISGWNYVLSVVAGEYYELIWSTSNHTNVQMQYYTAGSPPPSAASVIMTVTQQSGIMAGTGITAINSLTGSAQTLSTSTSGTDFTISSAGTIHTFNLPSSSASNRGLLSSTDWSTFSGKQVALVSGTNIKTVNSSSILGSGNLTVGDALVANPLSQFASTTSLELFGVISDETGTGSLVFANAPTLINPIVGTQTPLDNSTKAASTAYVDAAITFNYGLATAVSTFNFLT